MKRSTNPKTPKGWIRQLVNGRTMFRRLRDQTKVAKDRQWRIYDMRGASDGWRYVARDEGYDTWIEATTAADGGVE